MYCITWIIGLQYELGRIPSRPDKPVLLYWSNWRSSVPSLLYFTSIFLYLLGIAKNVWFSSLCFGLLLEFVWELTVPFCRKIYATWKIKQQSSNSHNKIAKRIRQIFHFSYKNLTHKFLLLLNPNSPVVN